MKITNRSAVAKMTTNIHNIDTAIARVVTDDLFYDTPDCDASVTGLTRPPQMAWLEQTHQEEIVEDIADNIWRLLGQGIHEVIRKGATASGDFPEERLFCEIDGWRIAGKADLFRVLDPSTGSGELIDWKVTSVYSFLLGDKPDWEFQDNANAYIWRDNGFPVTQLYIKAILRDWKKREAQQREDYPPIPYQEVNVPVWDAETCERRMMKAVHEHRAARQGKPRPCTPIERWEKSGKWAVMKAKQRRAVKLFDSESDASKFVASKPDLSLTLQERRAEQTRCQSYCAARPWCKQADSLGVPHAETT